MLQIPLKVNYWGSPYMPINLRNFVTPKYKITGSQWEPV
ncbi:hypothetical protein EMIT079MI2_440003 [Bacillus sp. IT-79MI2]